MRSFVSLVAVLSLALMSSSALATAPKLNSVSPPGGQRGTTVELKLSGSRLGDAPELVFGGEGIKVTSLEVVRTNQLKATISVAPDCKIGEHQLRIRTATGVSELRTFWVNAYKNLVERETNNTVFTAQDVDLNVTINGTTGGEDVDMYRVEARKGQRISAEVEAIRLGRAMLDSYLSIRDQDGSVITSADDTSLLAQDAYVSIIAPKDAAYFIEMRDSTYTGNNLIDYRLHIGTFPRPAMVFPLGGKVGDEVSFKFIGDPTGEFSQSVKLPENPQEKFGVFAEQDRDIAPSANWVRVSPFGDLVESEPNETRELATGHSGALPVAMNGIISKKNDTDWFRFSAKKGEALEMNLFARRLRSPLDSTIEVCDAKGKSLAANDDGAGADSVLKFNPPADGDYFVKIRDQFGNGGPDFAYRLEIVPQQSSVTVSIPQVARNDSQSRQFIAVPRGNRVASMISAKRASFTGDLAFNIAGLPGGVTMQRETLDAKLDQEPVIFEAAADAPIGGKYVDLVAAPTDTSTQVMARFNHEIEFVPGQNNSYYYGTREPQLYVAVCEEAPFSIHIEEPQAPLVQYGALDLKIVAERRGDFDEPINVKMMWNPPGVSSLPDITIPKGSNSAVYQLNAKADAQTRKWKLAVLGSAPVNGGPVFVSSQLATLEVGEPFVVGTMQPVLVSPGQQAKLVCKLDQRKPFEGKARVRVLGLPENVIATEAEITSQDKEVVIELKVGEKVPTASYRNFLCAADVVHNGQVIPHNLASGAVIRVVPPKKDAPKQVALKK